MPHHWKNEATQKADSYFSTWRYGELVNQRIDSWHAGEQAPDAAVKHLADYLRNLAQFDRLFGAKLEVDLAEVDFDQIADGWLRGIQAYLEAKQRRKPK